MGVGGGGGATEACNSMSLCTPLHVRNPVERAHGTKGPISTSLLTGGKLPGKGNGYNVPWAIQSQDLAYNLPGLLMVLVAFYS